MPRADPIVKKGVFNRREKITIDGLTATRAHHQALRRQHMNEKFRNIAKAKRQAADSKATQNASSNGNDHQHAQSSRNSDDPAHHAAAGIYHDYERGSMAALEDNEGQAAWAAAVEKVSGGRIKAKKEVVEKRKLSNIEDQTLVIGRVKRQRRG